MTTIRVLSSAALASLLACGEPTKSTEAAAQPSQAELVVRGEYLVTVGACHDCHTPKIMTDQGMELDSARLLSGHPAPVPPLALAR